MMRTPTMRLYCVKNKHSGLHPHQVLTIYLPTDVHELVTKSGEDAAARFATLTALLDEYQQRAHEDPHRAQQAEAYDENLSALFNQANITVLALRLHRDQLQEALTNATGAPPLPPPPLPPVPHPTPSHIAKSERILDPLLSNGTHASLSSFTLKIKEHFCTDVDRSLIEEGKDDYMVS